MINDRKDYDKKYRKNKKDLGICVSCQNPRRPNKNYCVQCFEKSKELRNNRYNQGLCVKCGKNPHKNNIKYCEECSKKSSKNASMHFNKKRSEGLCICGKPSELNKKSCKECLVKCNLRNKKSVENRIKQGLCARCSNPSTKGTFCDFHYNRTKEFRKEMIENRRKNGFCEKCGSANIILSENRQKTCLCKRCFLKNLSSSRLGTVNRWQELESLFLKQNICPYTGIALEIGVNASLDHIIPVSKGGTNDITNLQFVYCFTDFDVNSMKLDMTHDEFIKVIKKINNHLKESNGG